MVDNSVEKYADAKGNTRTVAHKELFWIRMCDVQVGLGIQNVSDLVRIKPKSIKEKELDKNCAKSKHVFVRSDLMARVIKNSRGEKK